MKKTFILTVKTHGEGFVEITQKVRSAFERQWGAASGLLFLFIQHTSCALTITEAFDSTARMDMENFLRRLIPSHQEWHQHTAEGPDDSPSHMKSLLLHQHLVLPVEEGQILLGQWQGIYLAEFRSSQHERKIVVKFLADA